MSEPARKLANDVDDVYPFIHFAAPLNLVMAEVDDLRKADLLAREEIEGGPRDPSDVPGAGGDA